MKSQELSVTDDGYFGLSLLEMGSYGAELMVGTWISNTDEPRFKEVNSHYYPDHGALTIEGTVVAHTRVTWRLVACSE